MWEESSKIQKIGSVRLVELEKKIVQTFLGLSIINTPIINNVQVKY